MADYIGIDVGATFIKAGFVNPSGQVHGKVQVPTDVGSGIPAIEARIREVFDCVAGGSPSVVCGVGLPGIVDPARGVVRSSPNIPCWHDYPARQRIEEIVGIKVRIENDANCAAIAEGWVGAGRGASAFLLVTLGTGVGGGIVLGGRVWHGDSGRGGEVGHIVVDPGGEPCGCGSRGCLETVASARGIQAMAASAGLRGNVEELAERARKGGRAEKEIFERAGGALGIAIADFLNILDVHTIVVGGGAGAALDLMQEAIRREALRCAYALGPGALRLLGASLGEEAGIVGAARLAMTAGDA